MSWKQGNRMDLGDGNVARFWHKGQLKALVSRDPVKERGIIVKRWHLSISHPDRYPTWDEIKEARYALLSRELTFAMIFPPPSQYVNHHPNCFHLHEIETEAP